MTAPDPGRVLRRALIALAAPGTPQHDLLAALEHHAFRLEAERAQHAGHLLDRAAMGETLFPYLRELWSRKASH